MDSDNETDDKNEEFNLDESEPEENNKPNIDKEKERNEETESENFEEKKILLNKLDKYANMTRSSNILKLAKFKDQLNNRVNLNTSELKFLLDQIDKELNGNFNMQNSLFNVGINLGSNLLEFITNRIFKLRTFGLSRDIQENIYLQDQIELLMIKYEDQIKIPMGSVGIEYQILILLGISIAASHCRSDEQIQNYKNKIEQEERDRNNLSNNVMNLLNQGGNQNKNIGTPAGGSYNKAIITDNTILK